MKVRMHLYYFGVLTTLACALAPQPTQAASDDSILDRLERKILDQERAAVSFGTTGEKAAQPAQTSYKYKGQTINEMGPSSNDMQVYDAALVELESQVEYLSSQVARVKQNILQDAALQNFVNITTKIQNTDALSFRKLRVMIDGHVIYDQNATLGTWMPDSVIPLYHGPMQPGNHRLDIAAKLVDKSQSTLPLQTGSYHIINESYSFQVPDGNIKKKWEISITNPKSDSFAKAEFKAL